MKELSKPFYLGAIFGPMIVSILLSIIVIIAAAASGNDGPPPVVLGLVCLIYPLMIFGVVVLAILVYKIWVPIQDGNVRTSPGKAVGFLFIPFFNFYWIFQAYWGWAVDYNQYIQEKAVPDAPRAPEGLALTLCILTLASILPVIGILIGLVNLVLMAIFLNTVIDGANAVTRYRTAV